MSRLYLYLALLGVLYASHTLDAQRLGLLPSSTKWYQLQHDSLRIIYPEGQEAKARRVASLMLKLASVDPIAKDSRYEPIPVVLQPRTNISNGYVGLAPYVSELYLQPNENPFQLGSLPWEDLLAIHEYRHVQQVNAINTSLSHIIKVIFGEQAFLGMVGLATTNWMREGDAVWMETKYSPQGRGRLSSFTLPFRERIRHEKPWNYYKLRNGSYKINVPDHYPLGYLMMQYGNHVFGEDTWDTIFRITPKIKPIYDPNSGVIKKFYGKSNKHLYWGAMDFFGKEWKAQETEEIHYPLIPITDKNKSAAYYDMNYPDVNGEGHVYCVITSFDSTSAIFKFTPDGHRERIRGTGLQHDTYFDQENGWMVWTEARFDPRWVRLDKNVIVLYDAQRNRKKDLVPEKGYFMPKLDIRGEKIVALHTNEQGDFRLHILEVPSGKQIAELPNPDNLYIGYPFFAEDGEHIIATARNAEGRMCLIKQNIKTGIITKLTHYSYAVLGRPVEAGPWIFMTCGLGHLDQVYAVDKTEGIFYQVSQGNSAHYDPTWDPVKNEIVCAEYTNYGKKLVRVPGDPRQWRMINLDDHIVDIPGASDRNLLAESNPDRNFETKEYHPWNNVVNVHSWRIRADDPVWAAELLSDNILNSMSIAAGYQYNRNNKSYGPYANIRMGMWFPELAFGYSNLRQKVYATDGTEYISVSNEVYTGVSVPLLFTSGVYHQVINVATTFNNGLSRLKREPDFRQDLRYQYLQERILLINQKLKAHRQPLPSLGQLLDVSYSHNVGIEKISQLYGNALFALPSFKPSNYILLNTEMLTQQTGDNYVQLSSRYAGPRGFEIPDGDENYKLGITYGFPLLYPDLGFGSIAYVRRIRLQPFFDYGYSDYIDAPDQHLSSAGLEVLVDFEFGDITIGCRFTRLLSGYDGNPFVFELYIPAQRF
jgi:hypothetical protein